MATPNHETYFSQWLVKQMQEQGLRQSDIARGTNASRAFVSLILTHPEVKRPSTRWLQRLAKFLNVSDETVFRAAGFLDPVSVSEKEKSDWLALYSRLGERERRVVGAVARELGRSE